MKSIAAVLATGITYCPVASAFKGEGRRFATRTAPAGMKAGELDQVLDANLKRDDFSTLSFGRDKHHFNDCGFTVASEYIRAEYRELDALLKADPVCAGGLRLRATRGSGFLSHSN